MRSMSLLAAGLACVMLVSDGHAQAPKDGPNNPAAIQKALDQNITLDYKGESLEDCLAQIGKKTNLKIVMDQLAVQQLFGGGMSGVGCYGVLGAIGALGALGGGVAQFGGQGNLQFGLPGFPAPSTPVHLKIDNGKVRTALENLLNQPDFTLVILGDTVLITTDEIGQLRQMRQRINVNINDQPLAEALKKLADDTGVNLLLDPRQAEKGKTKISLQLNGVALETAMRLICEMADVGSVSVGNVLFVTDNARADKMRKENAAKNSKTGGTPYGPAPLPPPGNPVEPSAGPAK